MRIWPLVAGIAGLVLGTAIVAYFGFGTVLGSLAALGLSGFAVVLLCRLFVYLLLGGCWWLLEPPPHHHPLAFVWGRLTRDTAGDVLPLSQLGGYVLGARGLTLFGPSAAVATATTVVDVTVELLAMLAYTMFGLTMLAHLRPGAAIVYPGMIGLAVGSAGALGFILVQRRGAAWVERVSQRVAARFFPAVGNATPVSAVMDRVYARRKVLAGATGLHLLGWTADGAGAWVALHLMGVGLGIGAVLTMESLLYAIRSIAFFVPNAVGVQEGAYVMLGGLFGLPPHTVLALSLLKRGRDVVIGIPVLLVWQALEGGSLFRRRERRGEGV